MLEVGDQKRRGDLEVQHRAQEAGDVSEALVEAGQQRVPPLEAPDQRLGHRPRRGVSSGFILAPQIRVKAEAFCN